MFKIERLKHIQITAHIILLNGTSSSGKTSIARQLSQELGSSYIYLALDQHLECLMQAYQKQYPKLLNFAGELDSQHFAKLAASWVDSFHDVIEAHLSCGQNLIVDHVLQEAKWKHDLFQDLKPYRSTLIGLFCSLEELERREQLRGDRTSGLARSQFEQIHLDCHYDLVLDTHHLSLTECIAKIQKQL